jgi:hypothetical protein
MTNPVTVEKVAITEPSDTITNALQQAGFSLYPLPQAALDALPAKQVWLRCHRKKIGADSPASDNILTDPAVRTLTAVESHAMSDAHAKQYR